MHITIITYRETYKKMICNVFPIEIKGNLNTCLFSHDAV